MSVLGAVLGHRVTDLVADGLARLGVPPSGRARPARIPDLAALPATVRTVVETAYGDAIAHMFLVAAPFALIALIAVVATNEVPLRRTLDLERRSRDRTRRRSAMTSYGDVERSLRCCCAARGPGTARSPPRCTPTCSRRRTPC